MHTHLLSKIHRINYIYSHKLVTHLIYALTTTVSPHAVTYFTNSLFTHSSLTHLTFLIHSLLSLIHSQTNLTHSVISLTHFLYLLSLLNHLIPSLTHLTHFTHLLTSLTSVTHKQSEIHMHSNRAVHTCIYSQEYKHA